MSTHNFRIVLAQRRSKHVGRPLVARLAPAARLLSNMTGMSAGKCTIVVNEGHQFTCEFRNVAQYHETMLDYGYRIYIVTK